MGRDAQRAEGVQDHCNVDDLLQERPLHRGEIPESGGNHAENRQTDTRDHAFDSDPARRPRDLDPKLGPGTDA